MATEEVGSPKSQRSLEETHMRIAYRPLVRGRILNGDRLDMVLRGALNRAPNGTFTSAELPALRMYRDSIEVPEIRDALAELVSAIEEHRMVEIYTVE
jgi:hypothetical protein